MDKHSLSSVVLHPAELLSHHVYDLLPMPSPSFLPEYILVILKNTGQMTHPPECHLHLSPSSYMPL